MIRNRRVVENLCGYEGNAPRQQVWVDTFVVDDAADDKVDPCGYCDAATLLRVHRGVERLELVVEWSSN